MENLYQNNNAFEVTRIDKPCFIYRSDTDQYMQYGEELTIIFKDSDQAKSFVNDFPTLFECEGDSPFEICEANESMLNDKDSTIWYDDIADEMEEEKQYQLDKAKSGKMKGNLKNE